MTDAQFLYLPTGIHAELALYIFEGHGESRLAIFIELPPSRVFGFRNTPPIRRETAPCLDLYLFSMHQIGAEKDSLCSEKNSIKIFTGSEV